LSIAIRRISSLAFVVASSSLLLMVAFGVGLVFPQAGTTTRPLVIPVLALALVFSTLQVPTSAIVDLRGLIKPTIVATIFNYAVQGIVMLGAAHFLVPDHELWIGFVLISVTPPAIATIAFTDLLKGNTVLSLLAVVGAYLAAFVIAPAIALTLLGQSVINPTDLLITLVELILVPLALSRLLLITGLSKAVDKYRGMIANLLFCVSNYTVFAVNRDLFLSEPGIILNIIIVGFLATFVLGYVTEYGLRAAKVRKESAISMALLATGKNTGMAAGIALTLFSTRASVPAALVMAVSTLYVVWLDNSPLRK
jgi:BASS family bile acid:Na+ symporter